MAEDVPGGRELEPAAQECLERTRSAVLNVLIAVGLMIAVSGWILRGREPETPWLTARSIQRVLTIALIAAGTASYLTRRILSRRTFLADPADRARRFYGSHLIAAAIGALVTPLGLVEGWYCDSSLSAIIPFWVVPLTLGALALPRSAELAGFAEPMPGGGATQS